MVTTMSAQDMIDSLNRIRTYMDEEFVAPENAEPHAEASLPDMLMARMLLPPSWWFRDERWAEIAQRVRQSRELWYENTTDIHVYAHLTRIMEMAQGLSVE